MGAKENRLNTRPKKVRKVFTSQEKKGIFSLSLIFFFQMFGLFLILPVFSLLATEEVEGATPALVGLAMGSYGLTAALLQIPYGAWSDRIGRRPVITFGLLLFAFGSILAAMSSNIYWLILGRLLQGAGSMSSPIFALIADLTRPEVRARANAMMGGAVGLSFGSAMSLAPFLAHYIGLSGLFWVITVMSLCGLLLFWLAVPVPDQDPVKATQPIGVLLKKVLKQPNLTTLNFGAFACSMGLTATFFMLPMTLKANGWERSDWWEIYLSLLVAGGLVMVPSTIFAEVKNKFRQVMVGGILMILLSFALMAWAWSSRDFVWLMVALYLFFVAFNVFEPIFPSLVTRLSDAESKGTASGVYNFSRFAGQFAGGLTAGILYHNDLPFLPLVLGAAALWFLVRALGFPNPVRHASPVEKPE